MLINTSFNKLEHNIELQKKFIYKINIKRFVININTIKALIMTYEKLKRGKIIILS